MPEPRSISLILAASVCALLQAPTAQAGLSIRFIEGAPKDRFQIENTGGCDITGAMLRLDLSSSQGALIFDVSSTGAGVEVFQPFVLVEGQEALASVPAVVDGQDTLDLAVDRLEPGAAIGFTIDVDDTIGTRQITVTGSEIEGATVSITQGAEVRATTFNVSARAELPTSSC
ncbi:aggregation factor core [Falsiruegeria mediterranea]|uniref:aggregation factor core n=1 Tax=Falsiruegeria mediterranea TaxID=1280832 RepID=UPI0015F25D49|nr:aggregation factor core [Falsiruegeria mediterranea]